LPGVLSGPITALKKNPLANTLDTSLAKRTMLKILAITVSKCPALLATLGVTVGLTAGAPGSEEIQSNV